MEIKPYKIASQDIWNMSPAERDYSLKLDWNEATIPPSPKIKQTLLELILDEEFYQFYPAVYNKELTEAISDYAGVFPSCVQYFVGSDTLHEYIAKCWITKECNVLMFWPTYDNFRFVAQIAGANIHFIKLEKDFSLNENEFLRLMNKIQPNMVYMCNPNNPTGTQIAADKIMHWVEMFPSSLFVIDEAYSEFSGITVNKSVITHENLLVSHTMSKAFGLANFRFGYLVASESNIAKISGIRNPKNISTITQAAVLAALKDVGYMKNYVKEVNRARKLLIGKLTDISQKYSFNVYNSYANFFIIKFNSEEQKKRIYQNLKRKNIFVRDLVHGNPVENSLRITVGTRAQMEVFFEKFIEILEEK